MEAGRIRGARRWLVAAAALVHAVYLATLIAHFFAPPRERFPVDWLFRDSAFSIGPGSDFYQFYQAGADILAGRDFVHAPAPSERAVPYSYPWVRYPPFLAFTLGIASNLVPPQAAYALWCLGIEVCLVLCVLLLCRRFPAAADRWLVVAVFLVWSPFYTELYMGQTSFILGTLVLVTALANESGNRRREAVAYCASVLFKYQTLVLGLFYLRQRRLRLLAGTAALLLLANGPLFLLYPEAWKMFTSWTVLYPDTRHVSYVGNFGVPAFLAHLTGNDSLGLYRVSALAILVLSSLWTLLSRQLDPVRTILLWITTLYFVLLTSWEHNYNLLLPVLMLEYLRSRDRVLLFSLAVLALPTPFALLVHLYPHTVPRHALLAMVSFKALPVLLIYGSLLLRGIARRASD
jgi:hypothetical protein